MELLDTKIIVALIALFVSFVGLIISKEQKTSEFRQIWIDKIRDDISNLLGYLSQFVTSWHVHKSESEYSGKDFLKENVSTIREIHTLLHRIRLRLNPKKDGEFIDILDEIENIITSPVELKKEDVFENKTKELSDISHSTLKNEWTRVKRGEPIFQFTRYLFGAAVLLVFIYFSINAFSCNITKSETIEKNTLQSTKIEKGISSDATTKNQK